MTFTFTPRHNLTMRFTAAGGAAAEPLVTAVGLREATNDLDENNNARFVVNGKQILIRGGGFAPDLLQVRKLAHKLGQLQAFISVFPQECMGQLVSFGPT